ncbi:MAG: hypothetical protein P8Y95_00355 [Gammaproteobacteria bacterium]|jgi:hypothetical protein
MKPLIVPVLLLIAAPAFADNYECRLQGLVRTISVVYEGEGPVPCHVEYDKPTEGMTQIPWNAQNEAGYCEARAKEFMEKLQGWGWACTARGAAQDMGMSTSGDMGMSDSDDMEMSESEDTEMGEPEDTEMGESEEMDPM